MAQMFSSAGISVPQSDLEDVKITKTDKVLGVSDSECQRLMVARYVAGAVATGAVRAEAEAELQTVLAEKSKEIARLKDKLQYYEVVNHEMSQRNQESIGMLSSFVSKFVSSSSVAGLISYLFDR